jgi:8-oxo-dGTP diphosphatase
MTTSAGNPGRVQIVAALLRERNRVLLCHRSVERRWYPDVWDLAGGHVEPGEVPGKALVRELREELGIVIDQPSYPPMKLVQTTEFDMRIWLVEAWAGAPTNTAPHEHDAIGWFGLSGLSQLRLAHDSYLPMITEVLAEPI